MNINNNSLSDNVYEHNFTNRFNNSDNLPQPIADSSSGADDIMVDMYTCRNNVNNVTISDQQSMSSDVSCNNIAVSNDVLSYNHCQQHTSNDISYNNVSVSNDATSYNSYQQPISNDASYGNFTMSNDVSYNLPMPNDVSYNNNITISQNNDQNPSPPNNNPSFNSLNIVLHRIFLKSSDTGSKLSLCR
ncbi:hypothetical protein C1645_824297 [Glomus cerebriforme]|uniref:Uncharacterized protein n=1 Tax=Glomus cerebriforme TaxID=658196 RepID=A0A397SUB9_9GLOM|nr:hypothetical protein C1645_824295 [Glomus cerebriforme]RIA89782.1 hypothetical protein C1645_824297 [Glomus cerebriforme]